MIIFIDKCFFLFEILHRLKLMDLEIDIAIIRHHFHPPYVFRYLKNFDYQMLNRNLSNSKNINIFNNAHI